MKILTLRTDKPEAEVGIFEDTKKLDYFKWEGHRQLSVTIYNKIDEILNKSSIQLNSLEGIVIYKGPGSFTGLRIGFAAANSLAYGLSIPVISSGGDNWTEDGIKRLQAGENEKIALPEYGAPVYTTKPKK
jgi:tRNA threonylcarbamoyladenosine biosynthesis protein TsaB